jgi:eukaryotic-like serine/threonine-protein kinase
MPRNDDTPRDLLFGLLALQFGLIDQDQLVAAFSAWTRSKVRPLSAILRERGAIDEAGRSALAAMVKVQWKKHGGDTEKSLASFAVGPSTRQKLAAISDTDLTASLTYVGYQTPIELAGGSPTMSIGTTTSAGGRFRVLRPHAQGRLGMAK